MNENRIREFRLARRLSQSALSHKARFNLSRLSQIEAGAQCLKSSARRIARALGEPVETVFPHFAQLRQRTGTLLPF